MLKKIFLLTILFTFNTYALALERTSSPVSLPGVHSSIKIKTPDGEIYATSQPKSASIEKLKDLKIKTLINLRTLQEPLQLNPIDIQKLIVNYVSIPISLNTITMAQVKQFHKVISNKSNYPILIHCGTGNRVAMMLAFDNIFFNNMSVPKAISIANKEGLTSDHIRTFIEIFAKEHKIKGEKLLR